MSTTTHACTADCWAHMLRNGQPDGCDPFDARAAADAAIELEFPGSRS